MNGLHDVDSALRNCIDQLALCARLMTDLKIGSQEENKKHLVAAVYELTELLDIVKNTKSENLGEVKKKCSFCGLSEDEVASLIEGAGVWICNGCVDDCIEILGCDNEYVAKKSDSVEIELAGETTVAEIKAKLAGYHYQTSVIIKNT